MICLFIDIEKLIEALHKKKIFKRSQVCNETDFSESMYSNMSHSHMTNKH